jgi:hypothetical protein
MQLLSVQQVLTASEVYNHTPGGARGLNRQNSSEFHLLKILHVLAKILSAPSNNVATMSQMALTLCSYNTCALHLASGVLVLIWNKLGTVPNKCNMTQDGG